MSQSSIVSKKVRTNDERPMNDKKRLDYAKMMTHRTSFCLLTRRTLSVHVSLCIRNRWLICTKRSTDKKATGTSVRGFQLDDIGPKPFPKQPFENLTCKRVKNKQNGSLILYFNQIELQTNSKKPRTSLNLQLSYWYPLASVPRRRCAVTWWYVPKVQVGGWLIDLLFSTRVIFIIGKRSRIWNSDIIDDLFCFVFVFAVCIIAENHNLWCFLACLLGGNFNKMMNNMAAATAS